MPQRHDGVLNLHTSGGSRPSDKGGGDPDPEIRGGGGLKKNFSALHASFSSENKGRAGVPGPLPWIRHCIPR